MLFVGIAGCDAAGAAQPPAARSCAARSRQLPAVEPTKRGNDRREDELREPKGRAFMRLAFGTPLLAMRAERTPVRSRPRSSANYSTISIDLPNAGD